MPQAQTKARTAAQNWNQLRYSFPNVEAEFRIRGDASLPQVQGDMARLMGLLGATPANTAIAGIETLTVSGQQPTGHARAISETERRNRSRAQRARQAQAKAKLRTPATATGSAGIAVTRARTTKPKTATAAA